MRKITLQQLKHLNACQGQVQLFRELFGNAVVPNEELAIEHASAFDWEWASYNLLSPEAWAEYKKVRDQALAEYEKVRASAWREYGKVHDPAWAEYKKVRDQAWAEYKKVCALAFVQLFNGD